MSTGLFRETEKLRGKLLSQCLRVEERVSQAIQAFNEMDNDLAEQIIRTDTEIDQAELGIEEECMRIMALYQPVAVDLRFVNSAIRINKDVERIADLAVKIAWQTKDLSSLNRINANIDFTALSEKVSEMLRGGMTALREQEVTLAYDVCKLDDSVDALTREMLLSIQGLLTGHPEWSEQLMLIIRVTDSLERIADLSGNIAEEVIYIASGQVIRHCRDAIKNQSDEQLRSWLEGLEL